MPELALSAKLSRAGLDWIVPDWPAPPNILALSTTKNGAAGRSADFPRRDPLSGAADENLRRLLPSEPFWLAQVHGTTICDADATCAGVCVADGAISRVPGKVCAVLTADCLPVLLANRQGSVVAAVHAGWRGLAAGVLEAAVTAMRMAPDGVLAWLGPAIGPRAFQVGDDVFAAFCEKDERAAGCFSADVPGKWRADLYALARRRLAAVGVDAVYGGGRCTYTEHDAFFSYRRGGKDSAARMATVIWLEER